MQRRAKAFQRNVLVTLLCVFVCANPPELPGVDIVAHRGASAEAPENTLPAFRLAWKQSADAIEGDFFLSRDGQVVCIHDRSTKKLADRDVDVSKSTLAELRTLDVGKWKAARWTGTRIPTIAEVLATVPTGKRIFIEIKSGPEILPALAREIRASGRRDDQLVIISFNEKVIASAARQLPRLKRIWVSSFKQDRLTGSWSPTLDQLIATAKRVHADGVDVQAVDEVVNAALVDAVHAAGLEFHVWTVNDPAQARRLSAMHVDSITTDRPQLIRETLGKN